MCEIFLCQGAQGGRGRGPDASTSAPDGDETGDKGVWMSVWVDDVDAVHARCLDQELDVTWPPTNMPWGVREMHVRHPDGHVCHISYWPGAPVPKVRFQVAIDQAVFRLADVEGPPIGWAEAGLSQRFFAPPSACTTLYRSQDVPPYAAGSSCGSLSTGGFT